MGSHEFERTDAFGIELVQNETKASSWIIKGVTQEDRKHKWLFITKTKVLVQLKFKVKYSDGFNSVGTD